MVLVLSLVTLVILASILEWATTNTRLSRRNNDYYRTAAIAEAATEKVLTRIDSDYKKGGDALVFANLNSYRTAVPLGSENAQFSEYSFTDGQGQAGKTYVEYLPPSGFRNLTGPYRGLYGYSSIFRIVSNARETANSFNITAGVRQDVETTTIPVFQFAIFYNIDLEIHPGAVMTVSGPVHGNRKIYLQPQNVLTFESDVTSAQSIIEGKKPGDPLVRSGGTIRFEAEHDSGVSSLNLPIGTNNTAIAVRQVVELPPTGEAASSAMGKERFYNKADMIVKMKSNGNLEVTSGLANNFSITIPQEQWDPSQNVNGFLETDSFYNKRESKTVAAMQINVGKLKNWSATNTALPNGEVTIIYVIDQRSHNSSTQAGVRLVNGQTLPTKGLTIASPNPIYVQGHYNVPNAARGTHDTSGTKPAALIGDAITVLSGAWADANATAALSARTAEHTTVNAAFLAGIVETVSGSYSGGVENFPRFLENWSGKKFTYNGSMVVMYNSLFATGLWQGTGDTIGIYNPPNRDWAFDTNFRDPAKLPPGTPCVRALIRSTWAMVKPNTTIVVGP